jgi:hypothetical protein
MNINLVGRKEELKKLELLFLSNRAEFLAIYGRRRVGKTYLIKTFLAKSAARYMSVSGQRKASTKKQISFFQKEIELRFFKGKRIAPLLNWNQVFSQITTSVKALAKKKPKEKIVIFLDELPWMCGGKSTLLSTIDHFWNTEWQYISNLKFIVCGSAASWMLEKVINAKGGLYNRLTAQICLKPLTVDGVKEYLKQNSIHWTNDILIESYMVFGGVPYYLNLLNGKESLQQNVARLCFGEGELAHEYDNLFEALFGTSTDYHKIVQGVSKGKLGLTKHEIAKALRKNYNGVLSRRIRELTECGFIEQIPSLYRAQPDYRYILSDEFLHFIVVWGAVAKKNGLRVKPAIFWNSVRNSQKYKVWSGYAFERFCLKNQELIKKELGFEAVEAQVAPYQYFPSDKKEKGIQIDLVYNRADKVITLIEIKHYDTIFTISESYYKELLDKRERFIEVTKTKKEVQLALVTKNGLTKNRFSELIQNVVIGELL